MFALALGFFIVPLLVWYFVVFKALEAVSIKAGFDKSCGRKVSMFVLAPILLGFMGMAITGEARQVLGPVVGIALFVCAIGLLTALMRFAYTPWPVLQAQLPPSSAAAGA